MREIKLYNIAKIQHWYIEIFGEEDSDYPNYRRIANFNRAIDRKLNEITDNKEEQQKIYNIIVYQSWNMNDRTFKPICDDLRALGYTIIQGISENQEYYQKHKKERIEYQKQWRDNNRDKVRKNNNNYKKRNVEKVKEMKKKWYEQNKEKILKQQRKYRRSSKGADNIE